MPLHYGHMHLIDTARKACEKLTIMLFCLEGDQIPCLTREKWLRETYPEENIITNTDTLPRDDSGVEHWDVWMDSIRTHTKEASFGAVFSSESYGESLAEELDATHVMVDTKRTVVPISGTEIRKNPTKYQKYLPECVRAYYTH